MRVAELCAGYGGLHRAISHIHPGAELAWYAEVDPDASNIMARNHPGAPNFGDITTTDWGAVEPVDMLAAGFPCQPFSLGGKRIGTSDERHLWPTGIQPAIVALRPATVILENVPGLLTAEHGTVFRAVLTDLDQFGYTTRWATVGACVVGACHHRHRVFIQATLAATAPPDDAMFGLPLAGVRKWPAAGMVQGGEFWELSVRTCDSGGPALPTPTARDAERGSGWGDQPGRPLSEVIAMLPTPTASDHTGAGRGPQSTGAANLRTATVALLPTPRASDGAKGGPNQRGSAGDLALPAAVQPERWGNWARAVARHESRMGAPAPAPTEVGMRGGQRLSPAFVEWMMMLPATWVTGAGISRAAQIKALGNGVVPMQAAYALGVLTGEWGAR